MDVDLRLLRSFVTMAEEGNVGRAAQRLYISQPALSKHLQRLEAFLDVELFHRHHRVLRLTPAGAAFLDDAGKLLAQAGEITARARNTARAGASQVTVAFVAGLVDLASALLQTAQQPGLDVRLLRVDWTDQTDCLRNGRADLSLVRLPIDERDLEHQVLISEPRVAGLASTHPLAARTSLSICELDAEPIIGTSNQQDYWTVSPRPSGATPILGPFTDTGDTLELLGKAPEPARAAKLTRARVSAALKRARRRNIPDSSAHAVSPLRHSMAIPASTRSPQPPALPCPVTGGEGSVPSFPPHGRPTRSTWRRTRVREAGAGGPCSIPPVRAGRSRRHYVMVAAHNENPDPAGRGKP